MCVGYRKHLLIVVVGSLLFTTIMNNFHNVLKQFTGELDYSSDGISAFENFTN